MALDASVIRCLVSQLQSEIIGTRIDKLYQPQKDELWLALRGPSFSAKLLLCANPSCPRLHLTGQKCENPPAPPMFCMLLRKHLNGGKITGISQYGFERIVDISIESYDELGDLSVKHLIIEIMGKHSNIILVNKDNIIIDSIKRIDISTSSVRQVLPGLRYKYPPSEGKLNPLETSPPDMQEIRNNREPEKVLYTRYNGISPQLAKEILLRGFESVMTDIQNNRFSPAVIYQQNKKEPQDFAALPLSQYDLLPDIKLVSYAKMCDVLDTFYEQKAKALALSRISSDLIHFINNNIERCKKKLGIFEKQIKDAEKRETYRIYGELLTANLYRIRYGDAQITVENYYDEALPQITIPLDQTLPPAKNAQKYFTRYNKAKTAEEQAIIQQKRTQKELTYLESVADEIARAETTAEIAEIKEELQETGYLNKNPGTARQNKNKASSPLQFEFEGYKIHVGKNNKQNDFLTLKTARSTDIWLHTKNIPGSHVIIQKKDGEEIPDSVIVEAAKLAALHSKAKDAPKVAVDYTIVKNVKKPSGAKPGMVIYDHYNTIYVNL